MNDDLLARAEEMIRRNKNGFPGMVTLIEDLVAEVRALRGERSALLAPATQYRRRDHV